MKGNLKTSANTPGQTTKIKTIGLTHAVSNFYYNFIFAFQNKKESMTAKLGSPKAV